MQKEEVGKLLLNIKGNWYRQPSDRVTIAVWHDTLKDAAYADAIEAVALFRGRGDIEPPNAGQILVEARNIAKRNEDRRRSWLKELPMGKPSEEEKARVRQLVEETCAKMGR